MKIWFFLIGILLVSLFSYWAKASRPDYSRSTTTTPPLTFETVIATSSSGIGDEQTIAITTADDWQNLWNQLHAGINDKPVLPVINFTQEMLIAAMAGDKSSGGYSLVITSVHESNDRLIVSINQTEPDANCLTTSAITSPMHLIKLKRNTKPITVKKTVQPQEC